MKPIGNKISEIRSEKQMTRYRLAINSGISFSYIASLEEGRNSPSLTMLAKVAKGLNVPITMLIDE